MIRNKRVLVRNGRTAPDRAARRFCLRALEEALQAADPNRCLKSRIKLQDSRLITSDLSISLSRFRRILLLAVGKASASMMRAAIDILRGFPIQGICVVPREQVVRTIDKRVEVLRAGHPIPDRYGLEAAHKVAEAVRNMREDEFLLCLVSGGASAMLPSPPAGVTLRDKCRLTKRLVSGGATIHEINTVRRHLSSLKGGRMVEKCRASTILSLIVSDVPGNNLPDIGSGLTVEDPTTYEDSVEVLKRRDLWDDAPQRIRDHLIEGSRGHIRDTPKPGAPSFRKVHNLIIADNRTACMAAWRSLNSARIQAAVLTSSAEMEASRMGKLLASLGNGWKQWGERPSGSRAAILGGETTVQVKGKGAGGRNQETVLWAVEDIANLDGVVIAALGTDGTDGNSKAAGALADGKTTDRAKRKRLEPNDFLARNDSYRFFRELSDNLVTNATGTNVADIYLMIAME